MPIAAPWPCTSQPDRFHRSERCEGAAWALFKDVITLISGISDRRANRYPNVFPLFQSIRLSTAARLIFNYGRTGKRGYHSCMRGAEATPQVHAIRADAAVRVPFSFVLQVAPEPATAKPSGRILRTHSEKPEGVRN